MPLFLRRNKTTHPSPSPPHNPSPTAQRRRPIIAQVDPHCEAPRSRDRERHPEPTPVQLYPSRPSNPTHSPCSNSSDTTTNTTHPNENTPHHHNTHPPHPQRQRTNPRRPNPHQPALLTKAVQSDRRRSIKLHHHHLNPSQEPSHARKPSSDSNRNRETPIWPHHQLANLLRTGNVADADECVRCIATVSARDDRSRLKMISDGLAQSIISLLHHNQTTLVMRRNATFVLAELAVLEACEHHLVDAGTVPVLIWLLHPNNNHDRATLTNACRALRNILVGQKSTAVMTARLGCVQPLLAIVGARVSIADSDTVTEAAGAIANFSLHGRRFQSYVIKHGGLASLARLGTRTENQECFYHVVNSLAEYAREARWHKLLVSNDALHTSFRALQVAKDDEVVAEAARLIGNVACSQKSRVAVRDAGALHILFERLNRCSLTEDTPAFDIIRALANVCLDTKAASEALTHHDGSGALLRVFVTENAPEQLIDTSFRALIILAHGSAIRRAKVCYAVGLQVKNAGLAGMPVKNLYDLRQAILEEANGARANAGAMPESLERLSRMSVKMINSGVARPVRAPARTQEAGVVDKSIGARSTSDGIAAENEGKDPNSGKVHLLYEAKPRNVLRGAKNSTPNRFKSTGRIVSVARQCRKVEEGENKYEDALPRGSEEAKASDADLRARMLAREADGNMTQDIFEIGQVLGKGGYGSVFMAKNMRSGEIVAIKKFHNSGALVDKKAIKEQNIWKGLHHPNVVEFQGSFVGDNGSLNLVVEYVDGLSLAEHLSQYSAFPETLVAEIARQVLCGLQYLHGNGVTHRDLKPANILVDHSAAVKICDFGVSRSDNVQTLNPGQNHMVGTPWYIAPEMVENRPCTTSVDVWSLGCTVLELATGKRPYHDLTAVQALFRMVEDKRPPIPNHLSPEARHFLSSCWIWDPQQRPSAPDLLNHSFILKSRKLSASSMQSSLATPPSSIGDT